MMGVLLGWMGEVGGLGVYVSLPPGLRYGYSLALNGDCIVALLIELSDCSWMLLSCLVTCAYPPLLQ